MHPNTLLFAALASGVYFVSGQRYNNVFNFITGLLLIFCTSTKAQEAANPIYFPTTGTVLTVGTNANIIWKNTTSGSISVILWKGDPGALAMRDIIADNIENTGSVLWPIDSSLLTGNDYSIMLTVGGKNSRDIISFTPLFTIITFVVTPTDPLWTPLETILATPTATALYQNPITSPGKGTVVMAGTLFEITWTKTIGNYVSFELFKGKFGSYKSLGQFAVGVQNTGSYTWSVDPSFVGGPDYILEIWALGYTETINNGINWSQYFTISSKASSSIEDLVLASVLSTASASLPSSTRTTQTITTNAMPSTISALSGSSSGADTSASPTTVIPDAPPQGLSSGARVAIGVVIPVAIIAGALGMFFIIRYRKRHGNTGKPTSRSEWRKPELDGTPREPPPELGGNMRELVEELDSSIVACRATELHSASAPPQLTELDGRTWRPVELPAMPSHVREPAS